MPDRLSGAERIGKFHQLSGTRTPAGEASAKGLQSLVTPNDAWKAHRVDHGALRRIDPELAALLAFSAYPSQLERLGREYVHGRGRVGDARAMSPRGTERWTVDGISSVRSQYAIAELRLIVPWGTRVATTARSMVALGGASARW